MKIRTRLFLTFLLLVGVGVYILVDWLLDDLRPRYLETMEESMVDTATLLASQLSAETQDNAIRLANLHAAFDEAQKRRFAARIYEVTKTRIVMRVYVTDRKGLVIFDSDAGRDEGKDYSRWNDVMRTLRGQYGARTTRTDPDDPKSAVLYVAAPVRAQGEIVGVLTVCKPADSVTAFLESAKRKIIWAGILAAGAVVLLGMVVSAWITHPIHRLTAYARAVRDGKRTAPPRFGRSEMGVLGSAFEEMRDALEGKQYVENYVQTLTHEMKSPLSAMRGAAELLDEDMDAAQRRRFLANLRNELQRIQSLVDRLLQLSALENRKALRDVETVALEPVIRESVESLRPLLEGKGIQMHMDLTNVSVQGERFLIRQAVVNLLHNAIDFTPDAGEICIRLAPEGDAALIRIQDNGPGVPAYAQDKVFDRFYSLQRPGTGKKSSGLGLAFVREVALLHSGEAGLTSSPEGGACATLRLPVSLPKSLT